MSRTYVVCYLLLISSLGVSAKKDEKSFWNDPWFWGPAVVGGDVVGAAAAPFVLGAGPAGLGFTAAGIKAGSVAAGAMFSAATTGVGAGVVAAALSAGDEKSFWNDPWCWGAAVVVSALGGGVAGPVVFWLPGSRIGVHSGTDLWQRMQCLQRRRRELARVPLQR